LSVVRCKIVRRKEKANILIKQNLCFTSYKALLYVLQSNAFQIGMIRAKQIILEIQKDKFSFSLPGKQSDILSQGVVSES